MPSPVNTRMVAYEAIHVRETVDAMLSNPFPLQTIAQFRIKQHAPGASAFERYIGAALDDAGGNDLAKATLNDLRLTAEANGHRARLSFTRTAHEAEHMLLESVENAFNRLCIIADAIERSALQTEIAKKHRSISISFTGPSVSPTREDLLPRIDLPPIGASEPPTLQYFNELDWRGLDHVAARAHAIFQSSVLPNLYQSVMGAFAPDGSDWDVRTRLALILGSLGLPLRCRFRYDCDTRAQAISIRFTMPSVRSFPQRASSDGSALRTLNEPDGRAARMVYSMRLACLLAAAGFGSGRHIERVYVCGVDPSAHNAALLSCVFDRKSYVFDTLTAIDSGKFADPSLRFDPQAVASLANPAQIDFSDTEGNAPKPIIVADDGMESQRIETWLDERELPDDLKTIFRTSRICDIDTHHYHGGHSHIVSEALRDSSDSSVAAIARLEGLVVTLGGETKPLEDEGLRPLYCSNPYSRATISLYDDLYDVGSEAEAYLLEYEGALGSSPNGQPSQPRCYFRAPDALFHAHMGLSDLYERIGDLRGAEMEADRCIALAPTNAAANLRKADLLARQGRFDEAANILSNALRITASKSDCALLYYHLALVLWHLGREHEAAAIHVYTSSLSGDYASKASKVVIGLRKRKHASVIAHASPLAAAREMARANIPVVPGEAARTLIVRSAIGLACANAPEAAAPYASALASFFPDNPIIAAACTSIISGTQE